MAVVQDVVCVQIAVHDALLVQVPCGRCDAMGQLQSCSLSLGQRWEWKPESDALSNLSAHQLLGHDKQTGALALYDENGNPADVSVRTLTSYTRIFGPPAGN